jgi:hypothetical protein
MWNRMSPLWVYGDEKTEDGGVMGSPRTSKKEFSPQTVFPHGTARGLQELIS